MEQLPLCLSYALIHSDVKNWLMSDVLPTPWAPKRPTVYETASGGGEGAAPLSGGPVSGLGSKLLLRDLLLNESPLFTIPAITNKTTHALNQIMYFVNRCKMN